MMFDFENKFYIHFMIEFLGSRQKFLEHDWQNNYTLPLYWRTPPLREDHNDNKQEIVHFLDVSFKYNKDSSFSGTKDENRKNFQICLGVLRKDPAADHHYYSTAHLTQSVIKNHFESLSIDIETSATPVLAKSMARALASGIQNGDFSCSASTTMSLPMHYNDDIQQNKALVLKLETNLMLDSATSNMILSNVRNYKKNDDVESDANAIVDPDTESCDADAFENLLMDRLKEVMQQTKKEEDDAERSANGLKSSPLKGKAEGNKDKTKKQHLGDTPEKTNVTRPNHRPKFSRGLAGVAKNRRKKAKTLSYSRS